MKRAELIDELERLGSSPAPVPDRGRISVWERQLYLAFEPGPAASGHVLRPPRARIRRRRRQLLVAGLAVAAAASAAVVAVHRGGRPDLELQAASGAVVVLPDGSTMPIHPGDRIPSGGVIQTGANGSVTIDGTRVGPEQALLVDNGHLTLLPATSPTVVPVTPAPTPAPTASAPPATRPSDPRTSPSRSSPPPVGASASNAPPSAAATPSTAPAPAAPPPATTAAPAPPNASAPTPVGGVLGLTVGRVGSGIQLSWTSPNVASFGRYVIARASVSPVHLIGIAVLTDEQITSFIDPAAPHGVEVFYRVVALGRDDRLIAKSEIVSLIVEQSAPTTTTTVPSSSPSTTSVATTTSTTSTTTTITTTSTTSTTWAGSTPPTTTVSSLPATSEPASTAAWRPHR